MAAGAAVTKLFRNLRNISIGLHAASDLSITAAADLGGKVVAEQSATIIRTLLIPVMQANLAQMVSSKHTPAINLEKQLKVSSDAGNLLVQIIIPRRQILPGK